LGHRSAVSRQIAFGVAVLIGTACGSASAWATDDGYQNVFSSVLTAVGVLPQDRTPEIDYRERAPLVLPPKQELVKPEASLARPASWPRDPDVIARRKAAEEARAPMASMFDKHNTSDRAESKAEMLKHRAIQQEPEPDPTGCTSFDHSDAHCRLSVEAMRKQDAQYRKDNPEQTDTVTAGVEPERVYLTQPPKGYMMATKTVKATHEAPVVQRDESSPLSALIQRPHVDQEDSPNK
jgi:hypothetical protein